MEMEDKNKKQLLEEIEELRIKLKEAEETLGAVRSGEVDAIVVSGLHGEQVFTLTGAERAYRVLIETMNEGAASLNQEGIIIYCNHRLSEMLKTPLEKVIGTPMRQFIRASDLPVFESLIEKGAQENGKGEIAFIHTDGALLPVLLSISALQKDKANIYGITATDLTAQKHIEDELKRYRDHLEELVKNRTNELETSNRQLQEEITERRKGEEAIRESSEFNRQVIESAQEGIIVYGPDLKYLVWNPFMEQLTGLPAAEVLGRHPLEVFPFLRETGVMAGIEKALTGEGSEAERFQFHVPKTGCTGWTSDISAPLRNVRGEIIGVIGTVRDITGHLKLEDQLRHAQKMEAVGTLAGGIAHDFNNILNVIMGYSGMVYDRLEAGSRSKEQMNEVLMAADRAANLTKRLLVFSRKQVIDVKPFNVNEIIVGIQKMLGRIIRENIDFTLNIANRALIVLADAGQLEQVLMNLTTNASDAMPEGGRLTISTGLQELDEEYVTAYGYGKPGKYALITIADTGCGIDAETQKKIFEPFFTTKGIGEGTGLGLAISYGIIKQHNGYIKVYSEPGQGTEFKIYLPIIEETVALGKKIEALVSIKGGNETILVAEDDASLRKLSRTVLESFGYMVITAEDGEDAITQFTENRDKIQLVILDMIMPKKNGKEASEEIRKMSPGIKTLFMSGYTMDIIKTRELTEAGFDFILKPVSLKALASKVREILDR